MISDISSLFLQSVNLSQIPLLKVSVKPSQAGRSEVTNQSTPYKSKQHGSQVKVLKVVKLFIESFKVDATKLLSFCSAVYQVYAMSDIMGYANIGSRSSGLSSTDLESMV